MSSGSPPAAIAVIRVSGPDAGLALTRLGGSVPPARTAKVRTLRDPDSGDVLDRALVLFLPGPDNATGEDCAELHLHGGRAVIAAVEQALAAIAGLRRAEPGEFTRRAFSNGRLDLAEAEGLADLLSAETELQRRNAQALASGALSGQVEAWRIELLSLAAMVEADLDFSDEDDVADLPPAFMARCLALANEIGQWLQAPRAEVLKEGYRVTIAGPPNAGKSSLFNAIIGEDAAIATPIAGTTRDILLRSVSISGVPFLFSDTAGIRDDTSDQIERIGIERARRELAQADLVLWLGPDDDAPASAWNLETMVDLPLHRSKLNPRHRVSAVTGEGLLELRHDLVSHALQAMPQPGQVAVSRHQGELLGEAETAIAEAAMASDSLIVAEQLRVARVTFDRLTGRAATEDMLDALFGKFCIGK
ncbi:tRNA uridine-5-carboxymethylaminomethyl(34) synthesis GTPase MnmE [Croceicoccus ponticola]|uniref:tRNA uridine-5-carboxymethylaminomethyl(34) synthesis GTPase MnmE n=1 Tax=Croceicoccus ponticola TaxID=2217664 RepID=UPI001F0BF367|nr:tRNA uridine-5-carboxymethylaminomethyl(34) synthesis GTPase MnmE [Croceicoccus ponticola]